MLTHHSHFIASYLIAFMEELHSQRLYNYRVAYSSSFSSHRMVSIILFCNLLKKYNHIVSQQQLSKMSGRDDVKAIRFKAFFNCNRCGHSYTTINPIKRRSSICPKCCALNSSYKEVSDTKALNLNSFWNHYDSQQFLIFALNFNTLTFFQVRYFITFLKVPQLYERLNWTECGF